MVYVGSWTAGALHGAGGIPGAYLSSSPRSRWFSPTAMAPVLCSCWRAPLSLFKTFSSSSSSALCFSTSSCLLEGTRPLGAYLEPSFLQGINSPEDYETAHRKWGSSGGFSLQSGGGRGRGQVGREAGQQQNGRMAVGRAVWARGRLQPHSRVLFFPPSKSPRSLGFPVKATLPPWPPGHAETVFCTRSPSLRRVINTLLSGSLSKTDLKETTK